MGFESFKDLINKGSTFEQAVNRTISESKKELLACLISFIDEEIGKISIMENKGYSEFEKGKLESLELVQKHFEKLFA